MILSALLIALCTYSGALAGLSAGDEECALYLSGPGRTSAYDYTINLLKGNFGYEGQNTCITYEAVNQAYLEARNRILVAQPKGDWKPEDYASVGELVLDISINLARRYGLTYEEVEKGLPLIDTSRTLIREVCPPVFSHVECRAGKYRRLDGLCNNLQHPTWGSTNAPFQRLISPLFADGINSPRISHSGHDLPLSRVVSRTMHPDDGFHDHAGTVMVIAWGQFMDHDYTLTGTPLDPINRNDPEECCKRPPHLKHPYCNEIRIPDDDYFYRLFGVKCIDFVRAFPSPRPGCRLGSRIPFNTLTGAIDGNTVYGVTEKFARKLRTGFGGLLRMNPVFKEYGLKDLLPLKLDIPDEGCTRPNKNMYCFEAGEIRVNEQLILTVMHTLMAREHNRVANALAEVNPHWDDETLYQEARRINIAEIQHISYNEFLPILLGKDVMEKFGLVLEKEGFWDGYDPEVNPDVLAAFAAAAYRFGHSLLPTAVERWSKAHKFIASKRLSDLIRRPYDLYRAGVLDEYVMGLMNQVAQAMDDSITQEVTNHLFKKVGARFGMDLVSFNMQRGREFGLPGYMEFRKFCGLPGAETFQDLFGTMTNHTVRKYETIFEHPIDVDLWSGGVSERPLPGSMLGPTFACIIATQFSYSRRGDRFWFELPNQPSSFTPEQLAEIRKSRLARIICDNTDIIDTVQLYPMVLPDHELNPRVPCRSGIIPMMDFSKWAEPAPFHRPAKQYVTNASISNYNGTISEEFDTEDFNYNNTKENEEFVKNINLQILSHLNDTEEATTNDDDNAELNLDDLLQNQENTTTAVSPQIDLQNKNSSDIEQKLENTTLLKGIPESNVVLKYVYKKDDKVNETSKTEGHDKNSVTRIKRSHPNSQKTPDDTQNASEIVNYETLHGGLGAAMLVPSANIIRNSDLAEFSIQTLHQTALNKNPAQEIKPLKYLEKPVLTLPKFVERFDNSDSQKDKKPYTKAESTEKYDNNNAKEDSKRYRVNESNEKYDRDHIYSKEDRKPYRDDSSEKYDRTNSREDIKRHRNSDSEEKDDIRNSHEDSQRYRDSDSGRKYDNTESQEDSNRHRNNDRGEKYDIRNSREDNQRYRDRDSRGKYDNFNSREDSDQHRDSDSGDKYDNRNPQEDKKRYRASDSSEKYENTDSREDSKRHRDSDSGDKYDNRKPQEDKKRYRASDSSEKYDNTDSREDSKRYRDSGDKYDNRNSQEGNQRYRDNDSSNKYGDTNSRGDPKRHRDINSGEKFEINSSEEDKQRYRDNDSREKYDINNSKEDKKFHRDSDIDNRYNNNDSTEDKNNYRERLTNKRYENDNSEEVRRPHSTNKYNEKYDSNKPVKERSFGNSADSSESQEYRHSKPDSNNAGIDSKYIEKSDPKPYNNIKESGELESLNYPSRTNSKESAESTERNYKDTDDTFLNIKKPIISLESTTTPYYNKDRDASHESKNADVSKSGLIYSEPRKTIQSSNENSHESSEEVFRPKNSHNADYVNVQRNISLPKIQDVDLDDFSYERIQVNNKGEVEPSKEGHDNPGNTFAVKILNVTTPKSIVKLQNYDELHSSSSKESASLPSHLKSIDNSAELIHINDGEVKPVVELNIDTDSTELTDEIPNSALKTKELDQTLESFLGVKELPGVEQNDKIQEPKTPQKDGDLKQQFERIPLNYKHGENAEHPRSDDVKSTPVINDAPPSEVPESKETEGHNDGTLDTFTPPERYDENLNIKFDDLVINLPEIKLPDDILAYTRDSSPYVYGQRKDDDDDTKQNYYKYNEEQSDEQDVQNKKNKDKENVKEVEDAPRYYGYYGDYEDKQKYQKKQDDDEEEEEENEEEDDVGEDLYEKFVRERFGKQGSFEKRSENLQDTRVVPQNPELHKTVQNILKKTEDVDKQAAASGDPNAGYMWTLEYGENV